MRCSGPGRAWASLGEPGRVRGSRFALQAEENGVWSVIVREFSVSLCFKGKTINWPNRQRVSPLKQGEKQNDDKLIGNDKIRVLC